jgi:hypothetical protein
MALALKADHFRTKQTKAQGTMAGLVAGNGRVEFSGGRIGDADGLQLLMLRNARVRRCFTLGNTVVALGICVRVRCLHKHDLMLPLRQINPTGKSLIFVSSPIGKNFPLNPSGKSSLKLAHPVPSRGALAIVTNVGTGCGGRGSVGREK